MKSANIMGIPMENPVVIASGPWSRGIHRMKKALECGAGAVITESIVSESYPDTRPRYAYDKNSHGLQNIRIYSALELENWLQDLKRINRDGRYGSKSRLIASIMGSTASELGYIAQKVESAGIDGIELGLACPMGEGPKILAGEPELVYQLAKEVVDAVSVPVSVKLSADAGRLSEVVKAAEAAGVSGISGIDTLRCILGIDVETGKPALPTYGGYSGAPIKPVGLATVAGIVQSAHLPVTGMGGIRNHIDLLEYIMVGASSCGIGTEILLQGYDIIPQITSHLDEWLDAHGIADLDRIRGCSLNELKSFEEIKQEDRSAYLAQDCRNAACSKCISACLEKAVQFDDGAVSIDQSRCDGCGLCLGVCPENKIALS